MDSVVCGFVTGLFDLAFTSCLRFIHGVVYLLCVCMMCVCTHVEIRTALWVFLSFHLYLVLHWTQVLKLASLDSKKTEPSLQLSSLFCFQTFVLGVCVPHFVYLSGIGHLGLFWIMLGTPVYMFFVWKLWPLPGLFFDTHLRVELFGDLVTCIWHFEEPPSCLTVIAATLTPSSSEWGFAFL